MGFSRRRYWSGLPFPLPGNLPDPGIELRSPTLSADILPSELSGKPSLGYCESDCLLGGVVSVSICEFGHLSNMIVLKYFNEQRIKITYE